MNKYKKLNEIIVHEFIQGYVKKMTVSENISKKIFIFKIKSTHTFIIL